MNKIFFYIFYFFCLLPFWSKAQDSSTSGIWLLKDRHFLEGPAYQNGVPKIIIINSDAGKINFEMTTAIENKDTVERENYEIKQDFTLLSMTSTGRQKKTHLSLPEPNNVWIRQVDLSARGNINKPAIKIVDSLKFSEDGKLLTLVRRYIGERMPEGNQNYAILSTYNRVTAEELDRLTTTGKGVVWTKGLTWPEILEVARRENKYVFVDCYATWCGPCKKMDMEVFPLNWVGETMNKHFIAIKVQMDTAKNDPENIRLTYPIARQLERECQIKALPTYLFFNGNGEIVNKGIGSFKIPDFVAMLKNAADPKSQIYTQYRLGIQGKLSLDELKTLIDQMLGQKVRDEDAAKTLISIYIDKKFYSLNDHELLTKNNLEELFKFWSTIKTKDKIFKLLYHDPEGINQLLGKKRGEDYIQLLLEQTITNEEILPAIKKATANNKSPQWEELQKSITRKYGQLYAIRPILNAQVWWYREHKQWELYCKSFFLQAQIELRRMRIIDDPSKPNNDVFGLANYLNSIAWEMLLRSTNRKQLETALNWARQAVDLGASQNMPMVPICDTYGQLLYKLGRKEEAISYYKKMVVDRLPASARHEANTYIRTLLRMQQNEPTWEDRDKWLN